MPLAPARRRARRPAGRTPRPTGPSRTGHCPAGGARRCCGPPSPAASPPPRPGPGRPGCARPPDPAAPPPSTAHVHRPTQQSGRSTRTARRAAARSAGRCAAAAGRTRRRPPAVRHLPAGPPHSRCRSRSTASGSSCGSGNRTIRSCPRVAPRGPPSPPAVFTTALPTGRPAAASLVGSSTALPPGSATRTGNWPSTESRGADPAPTPRSPAPARTRWMPYAARRRGPARPAGPAPRRRAGSRSRQQQRKIVDHTDDRGAAPGARAAPRTADRRPAPASLLPPVQLRRQLVEQVPDVLPVGGHPGRADLRQPGSVPLGLEELHEGLAVAQVHQVERQLVRAVPGGQAEQRGGQERRPARSRTGR